MVMIISDGVVRLPAAAQHIFRFSYFCYCVLLSCFGHFFSPHNLHVSEAHLNLTEQEKRKKLRYIRQPHHRPKQSLTL